MINANLSWKNPQEVKTVGQHQEEKSRRRDADSRSSTGSTNSRPQTRDTTKSTSWTVKRKKPTTASSLAETSLPKAPILPYVGTQAFSLLFPSQETESLHERQTAPSIISASNLTEERAEGNNLLAADRAYVSCSRRTSVCSEEEIISESILHATQELGLDSKVSRVTTVTVTTSKSSSEKAESIKEGGSGEGPRLQLQLPKRPGSVRGLSSSKLGFGRPNTLSHPEPKSIISSGAGGDPSDTETALQQKKTLAKLRGLQSEVVQQLKDVLHPLSTWKPPADWQTSEFGAKDALALETQGIEPLSYRTNRRPSTHSGGELSSSYGLEPNDTPDTPPLSPLFPSRSQTQTSLTTPLQISPLSSAQESLPQSTPSTTIFTRTLRRMEIATPAILGQRVAETWDDAVDATAAAALADEDGLASVREEFEFENRLWVLTALGRLRFRDRLTGGVGEVGMVDKCILNLYGMEVDTWFLAAKNHRSIVHSLSDNPSSTPSLTHTWRRSPPNCRPLTSPLITTTSPYAPASFDLIISHSLPAILRSTDYPPFLRNCARMLKPGGNILISFVDTSPKLGGPLMAQWTESLKLKLEMQFRCTRPSALLPHWLGDVSRWAGGVKVETMDWVAVEEPNGDQWESLRSKAGRAVYRKLYEGFVETENNRSTGGHSGVWWWEDPMIVEECRTLRTTFQLHKYLCQKE